jgi:23S rRNA (cytidine1920-2'-O)/16S rRNA (cytidine1409-2'-O)-methyltransferase
MKKERLDKILVDLGYFDNKSKASAAVLAGSVKVNDEVITKAGFQLDPTKKLEIEVKTLPYVSRGGLKLEKALKTFDVKIQDRICLDAGASTGACTDCLLQNVAKYVYAVDVGYGQLAWKIRSDERVKVIERTNIKNCERDAIYSQNDKIADLLVADLSFISLEKVLPNFKKLLNPEFHEMICLIKPQFEAGQQNIEKGGVVRDRQVHKQVIGKIIDFVHSLDYTVLDLTFSSIKGPSGNIEYLIYFATGGEKKEFTVEDVVDTAVDTL